MVHLVPLQTWQKQNPTTRPSRRVADPVRTLTEYYASPLRLRSDRAAAGEGDLA